jgi:hypothetical protein
MSASRTRAIGCQRRRRFCSRVSRARYSASTSPSPLPPISRLATRTKSRPRIVSVLFRRKLSRSNRFALFRSTAPPTRRLVASPRRPMSNAFSAARSVNSAPSNRRPLRKALRKSAARVTLSCGRRLVLSSRSPWLGGDAPTPLLAASLQDQSASLGSHANQEAVRPLSLSIVRLKRALHDGDSGRRPPTRPSKR